MAPNSNIINHSVNNEICTVERQLKISENSRDYNEIGISVEHHKKEQQFTGSLIPDVNAARKGEGARKKVLSNNLQFSLVVNHDQDVWIQPLQNETDRDQGSIYTLTVLYEVDPLPTNRTNLASSRLQYRHDKLDYVQPMMSTDTGKTIHMYRGSGQCYRLKAGSYLLVQGFIVPTQRNYTIRIIGSDLNLKLLS